MLLSINRPHSMLPLEKKILWTTERSSNKMLKVFLLSTKMKNTDLEMLTFLNSSANDYKQLQDLAIVIIIKECVIQ